jgi:cellobiose-specific phosphotransferase system component IIC
MLRRVIAFVVAACAMVLLGSAASAYLVQRAWSAAAGLADGTAPAAIPFADRIGWAAHDLVGMFVPYATVTSIALLIAFLIAGALARFTGFRVIVFGLGGALALYTLFTILRSVLGTVGIFGARGAGGLAAQMAVGAIAGILFARLSGPRGDFVTFAHSQRLAQKD